MAEKGAFLTSTSVQKPSVFEVLAQENLAATIHPALKRIANFLASSNPQRYGWILKWFEEIYLLFNFTVQKHYLKCYDGSFAESFYGLRRFALENPRSPLSARERRLSLVCLTLLDYAWRKLDGATDEWRHVQSSDTQSWKAKLLRCHSALRVAWRVLTLATLISYVTGNSNFHSPLLRLAGVGFECAPEKPMEIPNANHLTIWQRALALVSPGFTRSLELGAFTLQFLQWWHSENGPRHSITALPVPSPPPLLSGAEEFCGLCPICLQTRRIETALPISGFVFCYRCIVSHLAQTNVCPVSGYPAKPEDLIRVYADTS